jgi:predicted nuclease with TOPRIM domain
MLTKRNTEEISRMVELEKKCKAVETENAQLRQRMQNSQILQDEIERLTAKYDRARKDLESHSLLQVEHDNLLKQTARWYRVLISSL